MKDRILDELASEKQEKWEKRKQKRAEYEELRKNTSEIYKKIQAAREEVDKARDNLNYEYESLKEKHPERSNIWKAYQEKRAEIDAEIAPIRTKSNEEHRLMNECFDKAKDAFLYGDKNKGLKLSDDGRKHQDERDRLNAEVKEKINRIRAAKKEAMELAPPQDRYAFDRARERFDNAKRELFNLQEQFSNMKCSKNDKYEELQTAEAEFQEARKAFEERLKLISQPQPEEKTPKRMSFFSTSWFK